jgi:hypothetical protein
MRRINVGLLALITVLAYGQFAGAASQFFPPKYYKVGSKNFLSFSVITADFNNGGVLDLAVADYLNSEVSVLLGKPDGSFEAPIIFQDSCPSAIASGDLNGDGNQDLVTVALCGTGYGEVSTLLGDGKGHFKLYKNFSTGREPAGLALADFNGDGKLDVALTNAGYNGQGESLMVFVGDGKGGLGKPTIYPYHLKGGNPGAVAAGDLTGNGRIDLAVAVSSDKGYFVEALLNDGTGKLTLSGKYPVTGIGGDIKLADLSGSGHLDIAVAGYQTALNILLNKGNGEFKKSATYPSCHQCGGPNTIVVADFNMDGIPDIACTGNLGQRGANGIFYGKGKGKFKPEVTIPNVEGGAGVTSGDFDHNGSPDLVISIETNKVGVLLNRK